MHRRAQKTRVMVLVGPMWQQVFFIKNQTYFMMFNNKHGRVHKWA